MSFQISNRKEKAKKLLNSLSHSIVITTSGKDILLEKFGQYNQNKFIRK
jgi:hypothetical protein